MILILKTTATVFVWVAVQLGRVRHWGCEHATGRGLGTVGWHRH